MKKISLLLIVFLLPLYLFAENFYIDGYDIEIVVNEDGSAHIDERMNVIFTRPSHGIYRDIQDSFDNPVYSFANIYAKLSNIESNYPFKIETSSDFTSIKIGSENSYMESPSPIYISYNYDLGGDLYKEYDEFYYNFISAAWECPIRDINLKIIFPKPVDPNLVSITYGPYGSTNQLSYNVSNNSRSISTHVDGIRPREAITIRAEMEEGYFTKQAKDWFRINNITIPISTLIFVLFLVYTYIMYKRFGVDNPLTPPIVFYPPKDYNPMDVGYVYDRKLEGEREISAMFYYWADKGYLKLKEVDEEFIFIKTKDIPDDSCEAEKKLFEILFKSGDEVSFKDLEKEDFYISIPEKVFPAVTKQFTGSCSLTDSKSKKIQNLNTTLLILVSITTALISSSSAFGKATIMLLVSTLLSVIMLMTLSSNVLSKWDIIKKSRKIMKLIPIIFVALFIFFFLSGLYIEMLGSGIGFLYSSLTIASIILSSLTIASTDKRSEYGEKKLEEILGYKDFIEKVEIDKLKILIEEDPEIFYHTLSFAIVFGLEDCWAKKFKDLYIPRCNWYYSESDMIYDALFYSALVRKSRSQFRKMHQLDVANATPKSGGGGSSSFSGSTGFSGGGFSGGGGRSW